MTSLELHTRKGITAFNSARSGARPLLICDADEVLLAFFATLEAYLDSEGYIIKLESFALHGNVRDKASGRVAANDTVSALMAAFFEDKIHTAPAVEGAADALARLSAQADICVLTNLPGHLNEARAASLRQVGLDYPVICNSGGKGPAVAALTAGQQAPAAFIDDLPPNHDSVAVHAPHVERIHFIADPRLRPLIPKPDTAHQRLDDWGAIEAHVAAHFNNG